MNEQLNRAIDAVAKERGGTFAEAFKEAASLVLTYGETDLADRLLAEIPDTVSWEVVSDLLGILQWSTSDNGTSICRQAERWLLEGQDLRRVQVALNLDTYPFSDFSEMKQVLNRVALQLPAVAPRCMALIEERRQGESK